MWKKNKVKLLVMPETKQDYYFFILWNMCTMHHCSCEPQKLPVSTQLVNSQKRTAPIELNKNGHHYYTYAVMDTTQGSLHSSISTKDVPLLSTIPLLSLSNTSPNHSITAKWSSNSIFPKQSPC